MLRRAMLMMLGGSGALAAGAGLAGCARLLGPRTVEIGQDELQHKLAAAFPLRKPLLSVFDVTAEAPALRLLPEVDRVATMVPFTARDRWLGSTFKGRVGLSFGLRFEPSDLTLRLRDARVDEIDIGGLPTGATTRLGAWLAQDKLRDFAIHQFKPDDLRTADRLGYRVDTIKVIPSGLQVRLVPREDAPPPSRTR